MRTAITEASIWTTTVSGKLSCLNNVCSVGISQSSPQFALVQTPSFSLSHIHLEGVIGYYQSISDLSFEMTT